MLDYKEWMESIDPKAYHKGEWRWEEDGFEVTRTNHWSPPGCHDSCGILVYTKDGKFDHVEGDPYQPYSGGKLCMRCLDLDEAVNHPDRLKYPMKRDPKDRGKDKWERITWDEAYDMIEEKVRKAWAEHGPESIVCGHGTGRNTIFFQTALIIHGAFKSPNSTGVLSGHACYVPRLCGSVALFGDYLIADASLAHADRYANETWRLPEVIMVWGNEPLTSNGDGYLGHWLAVCHQLGSKLISVDPRLTWWGARAEYFLPLRPGTDAALACAFLHVITTEDLIDHEFVDCWCTGYEELCASVVDTTPEWAAEICRLDAEDIRGAARLYASGNPSTIQWGLAGDQQKGCMSLNLAHSAMIAICGNCDRPGGNILIHNAFEMNTGMATAEDRIPKEVQDRKITNKTGLNIDSHDMVASCHPDGLLYALECGKLANGEDYPIDVLFFHSSNALACSAQDAPRWYAACKNVPFIFNADPFMTPTSMALADLVLPIAMSCERNSVRSWWFPARTMIKCCSYYEAKTDEEITIELGRRLNPELFVDDYGWETDIDMCQWFMDGGDEKKPMISIDSGAIELKGTAKYEGTWQDLNEQGGWALDDWNNQYEKYAKGMLRPDGSVGFNTATGRVELAPAMYEYWGFARTPYHEENPFSPVSRPDLYEKYPLVWSSGGRTYEYFHSENRQMPTMREFHPWPIFQINPEDAEKYGIVDGQWAWIENEHGRFRQIAQVTERLRPGYLHAEHGWWFPEQAGEEPNLYGAFDVNSNNCTTAMTYGQGGLGSPCKGMLCRVYPYVEGDVEPGVQVTQKGGFGDYVPGVLAGWKSRAEEVLAEQGKEA